MIIFHNPRCSKSRQTLELIQQANVEPEVRLYLKDQVSYEELESILKKLDISPEELIRKGESIYKEQFKGKTLSDEEWINAMIEHPKLIERPIVIKGDQAVLGRPPENVLELLK